MQNSVLNTAREFTHAILYNKADVLRELLAKHGGTFNMSEDLREKETPLLHAVRRKRPLMVDIILQCASTNIDETDHKASTSLHVACDTPQPCMETITKLLINKANVNITNGHQVTPLMTATSHGEIQLINLLIEAGANIDALDRNFDTAVTRALRKENTDALKVLLFYGAKVWIPKYPQYNPLNYAICNKPKFVDVLISNCKCEINFSAAFQAVVKTNQIDIFQKLFTNKSKALFRAVEDLLLNHIISNANFAHFFDLFWCNITHEIELNPHTFATLIYKIFGERHRVSFFKNSLTLIINTPQLNCKLNSPFVFSIIFAQNRITSEYSTNYNWSACKDVLLDFCEYINRLGLKLKNYDLIIFFKYFQYNYCNFITELLAVFFKYDPELVTMYDVMYLSSFNDLNLVSQLLYNCSNLNLNVSRSIYVLANLDKFSEEMLKFFLQRFTPTKYDTEMIRNFRQFDHISLESLKVPNLIELARNATRKAVKNIELKKLVLNLNIGSDFVDILYFKTIVNHI